MIRSIWLRVALVLILAAGISTVVVQNVVAQTSPSIEVSNVTCFNNIYASGDLYCGVVYNLPTNINPAPLTTPEAWCDELINKEGCTGEIIDPLEPTSLNQNAVLIELFDNSILAGISTTPRIGYSVGGIYLSPGHNITWGDVNVTVCVSANTNIYLTSAASTCINPVWNVSEQNQESQREILGTFFINAMELKQSVEGRDSDFYVSDGLINNTGGIIVEEALPGATNILKSAFTISNVGVVIPTPTISANSLSEALATANPNVDPAFEAIGRVTSTNKDAVKAAFSIFIGVSGFIGGFVLFRNTIFAGLTMVAALTSFAPFDMIYMDGYFAMLGIMALFAAGYIVKKVIVN